MTPRLLPSLCLVVLLAACGADPRYIVEAPATQQVVRVPVATLEVKDMVLPGHASGTEILLKTADGNLTDANGAVWADDPVRGHTATLARALDEGSTALVAAEPWPLGDPAQAEIEVRVDRMLARADGVFELRAQVAITSRDRIIRDRIQRVTITTPLPSADAGGIAAASGTALQLLAERIVSILAN